MNIEAVPQVTQYNGAAESQIFNDRQILNADTSQRHYAFVNNAVLSCFFQHIKFECGRIAGF